MYSLQAFLYTQAQFHNTWENIQKPVLQQMFMNRRAS